MFSKQLRAQLREDFEFYMNNGDRNFSGSLDEYGIFNYEDSVIQLAWIAWKQAYQLYTF